MKKQKYKVYTKAMALLACNLSLDNPNSCQNEHAIHANDES